MSRRRLLVYAGVALIAGFYALDDATKTVTLEPANVISVAAETPDQGSETWRVIFELSDRNEYTSEPVSARPDLAPGTSICVAHHDSTWSASRYFVTEETICWTGAVAPLRAPG